MRLHTQKMKCFLIPFTSSVSIIPVNWVPEQVKRITKQCVDVLIKMFLCNGNIACKWVKNFFSEYKQTSRCKDKDSKYFQTKTPIFVMLCKVIRLRRFYIMVTLRVNGLKISLVNTSRPAAVKTKTPRTFKQKLQFLGYLAG